MENILKQISKFADEENGQTRKDWLGNKPVSAYSIQIIEHKLGLTLPDDYKFFLSICNGFSAPNQIEPTFLPIEKIDYLKNIDPYLVEIWNEETNEVGKNLLHSILIAGLNEEQHFLLIPPF